MYGVSLNEKKISKVIQKNVENALRMWFYRK